jgi:Tfp pilus assembly protein PilF
MASIYQQKDRVIFPRWRDFKSTSLSGDINPIHIAPAHIFSKSDIELKISQWEHERSFANASELVNATFNLGLDEYGKDAANFLKTSERKIPLQLKKIINSTLGIPPIEEAPIQLQSFDKESITNYFRHEISIYRKKITNFQQNAIAWVELARLHAILGNIEKAERGLITAFHLSKNNRYVLRSLARFFIHSGEPDKALYYFRKSDTIKADPWLLATQITIANKVGSHTSHLIKYGNELIQSKNYSPFDLNELASALATLELYSGQNKTARKLFNQSLITPNDNSVAQASWASSHLTGLNLDEKSFYIPSAYEARANDLYSQKKYQEAFNESIKWLLDEPFASRSARFSTYLASTFIDDFKVSVDISLFSLQIDPNNFDLLNNLAYSLCRMDRVEEAKVVLDKMFYLQTTDKEKIIYDATLGLYNYRIGNVGEAKSSYKSALKMAKELGLDYIYRLALVNYVREELLVNPNCKTEVENILNSLKSSSDEDQIKKELEVVENILSKTFNISAKDFKTESIQSLDSGSLLD